MDSLKPLSPGLLTHRLLNYVHFHYPTADSSHFTLTLDERIKQVFHRLLPLPDGGLGLDIDAQRHQGRW